jgi:hypothetical protein
MQRKLFWITDVDFDIIDQLLTKFSISGEKMGVSCYSISAIYRFQESL